MARRLIFGAGLGVAVASFQTNLPGWAPGEMHYFEGDVQAFIWVLEEWLQTIVNETVEMETHFQATPAQTSNCSALVSGCPDIIQQQAANDAKGLVQFLIHLVSMPTKTALQMIHGRTPPLGYLPSAETGRCLARKGVKLGAGGASGGGIQFYCNGRLLVSAGGGGGGGIEDGMSGGGGGGGAETEGGRRSLGAGGGGVGGMGYRHGAQSDETNASAMPLLDVREVKECYLKKQLSIRGGGGGGGSLGRGNCTLGYSFNFTFGPPLPVEKMEGDHGDPFQAGALKCGGFEDWTCVCEATKRMWGEPWVKELECSGREVLPDETGSTPAPAPAALPRLHVAGVPSVAPTNSASGLPFMLGSAAAALSAGGFVAAVRVAAMRLYAARPERRARVAVLAYAEASQQA